MRYFLPDLNVWLALSIRGHVHHQPAADWLNSVKRSAILSFTRPTQSGLLRLLTTEQVISAYQAKISSNDQAWRIVQDWLDLDYVEMAVEAHGIDGLFKQFGSHAKPSPKLWMDAYLAAFAVRGGHQLVTFDAGFSQLKGLQPVLLR